MAERPVLGYLTSAYARAADTFIRGEVQQLRAMGFTVHTFSIRRSGAGEMVNEDVRREQASTHYLFDGNYGQLLRAAVNTALTSPGRMLSAVRLALRIRPPGIRSLIWHMAYLLEASLFAQLVRRMGIDHLHNHIGENSAAVVMLASTLSGVGYSLTIHGPNEFDRPERLALGEKIQRARFVIAVSEFGRSQMYRWSSPEHWGRIHIVRCGLNSRFLEHPPTPVPDPGQFVCVGRLCSEKGQLLLLEGVRRLVEQSLAPRLVFVGDGPVREEMEGFIRQHGLDKYVDILGWMSSDQVREQILASRALVLPSFAEGLPVAIMEALALHRPVISTYIAGIPELVEPGVNGWLVPAGSVEALVEAMRQAMAMSPAGLGEMGRAGARKVRSRHDAETETLRLGALFMAEFEIQTCSVPLPCGVENS